MYTQIESHILISSGFCSTVEIFEGLLNQFSVGTCTLDESQRNHKILSNECLKMETVLH